MTTTCSVATSSRRTKPDEKERRFHIVAAGNGAILMRPADGNAVAIKLSRDDDFVFRWDLSAAHGSRFQLVFTAEDMDGVPLPAVNWPFPETGEGLDCNATPWKEDYYENTVVRDGTYKYSVFVQDRDGVIVGSVDPMIIVGRIA